AARNSEVACSDPLRRCARRDELLLLSGARTDPLGLAVTLEFVGPLGVALVGSRRPMDLVWVLLAGAGIFLLSPWAGDASAIDPLGAGLALLAGAFWAAYILVGARTVGKLTEVESVTAGMVVA